MYYQFTIEYRHSSPVNSEQMAKKKQDRTVYPYTLDSSDIPFTASANFRVNLEDYFDLLNNCIGAGGITISQFLEKQRR